MGRASLPALIALLFALVFPGCAGRHLEGPGEAPAPSARPTLDTLQNKEYWEGISFNNSRIGFTHFTIAPAEKGCFEIRTQSFMSFKLLSKEKKVSFVSFDLVDSDLRLKSFKYDFLMDESRLGLAGSVGKGVLTVNGSSGETGFRNELKAGELYPRSATVLYPLLHGLAPGRKYKYQVFDDETGQIVEVSQEVLAYEQNDQFRDGAYRMRTEYLGQEVFTWMSRQGLPLVETAFSGVLVSRLESREQAWAYLTQASLSRRELMLDFSLIRVEKPIPHPARVTDLEVYIDGAPEDVVFPSDGRQVFERRGKRILCSVHAGEQTPGSPRDGEAYLKPSPTVPSDAPRISSLAADIANGKPGGRARVEALLAWIRDNIGSEPVDVFSALDVLREKKAECQGHAYLYAALARSLGIPTRVANGVVYAEGFQGFLYHTWAESLVDGKWIAVDPTFCQLPADATHIKLVEGEALSSLAPLVGVMGKIRIEVVSPR